MEFVWSGRWDASARLLVLLVLLVASVLLLSAALLGGSSSSRLESIFRESHVFAFRIGSPKFCVRNKQ